MGLRPSMGTPMIILYVTPSNSLQKCSILWNWVDSASVSHSSLERLSPTFEYAPSRGSLAAVYVAVLVTVGVNFLRHAVTLPRKWVRKRFYHQREEAEAVDNWVLVTRGLWTAYLNSSDSGPMYWAATVFHSLVER